MTIQTAEYILEKVAPVFNKRGYIGTSLSDLEGATGMTKGAIYCNYLNKEELAVKAFRYNVRQVVFPLEDTLNSKSHAIEKLYALTAYFRKYYERTKERGGCPILNVGVDTRHINPRLFEEVKRISGNLVKGLEAIILNGMQRGEIRQDVDPSLYAKNIYGMIEGSVFMAFTHDNMDYLNNMLDLTEKLIKQNLEV